MDKEATLNNFFKTFKITFKNASIYNSKHPAFLASSIELKQKLDKLFTYFSLFKISFSSKSPLVEDDFLEKEKLYLELANMFHKRKLKNITFLPGITQEELTTKVKKSKISGHTSYRKLLLIQIEIKLFRPLIVLTKLLMIIKYRIFFKMPT